MWVLLNITDPDKMRKEMFGLPEFCFEISEMQHLGWAGMEGSRYGNRHDMGLLFWAEEFIWGTYCGSQMLAQEGTSFSFLE